MGKAVKSEIADALPRGTLLALARAIAQTYGFPAIMRSSVEQLYNVQWPQPLIFRNGDTALWVDKYYVAYLPETGDVRYLYVTRHHIHEETYSYKKASELRDTHVQLPGVIAAQFRNVLNRMRLQGTHIWIDEECCQMGFSVPRLAE